MPWRSISQFAVIWPVAAVCVLLSTLACSETPTEEGSDLSLFAAEVEAQGSFAAACADVDRKCRIRRRGCSTFRALCRDLESICVALDHMCEEGSESKACLLNQRFCGSSGLGPEAESDAGLMPPRPELDASAAPSPDSERVPEPDAAPEPPDPEPDAAVDQSNTRSVIPHPIFGVTTDSVGGLGDIKDSLASFDRKPTVRVVFDYPDAARTYASAVSELHDVAYVMGELLDSYYTENKNCRTGLDFANRVDEYLNQSALADNVDIWEIGNEVNGEWLCKGNTSDVYWTMRTAYDKVKAKGKATALTLFFYNEQCADKTHEMLNWVDQHIEQDMREGLDYVLISHYETACDYQGPWDAVFRELGERFPNSWLGFGEVGTESASASQNKKLELLDRYYGLQPMHPRYVGGYFWWYFRQDMVPKTKPLWSELNRYASSWSELYR